MGEAFLVQKNAAIKTPDPTVNLTSINFTSINVRLTNNHDKTVTMYYELDNALPNANTITVGANSFEDITLSSLSSNTAFTLYVYAKEDGQLPSDTLDAQFTTLTYTTQAPTINVTNTETDEVTFTLKNNDTSTVTMYYEVNDSTPDITATVSGGATITRTIGSLSDDTNYTLYARAQASNENMSSTVSKGFKTDADFITNGLRLYLDAADPNSYPGSGSEWYDLSGNNFHMSLKNGVPFNSTQKYFELNGSNDYGVSDGSIPGSVKATVNNLNIDGSKPKTVMVFGQVRNTGSTSAGLFDVGDTGAAGRHYCLRLRSSYTAWRAQFWSTPDYDFNYDARNNFTLFSVNYGTDKVGRTYVNNGSLVGQDSGSYNLVVSGNRPFEMGRYNGGSYGGFRIQAYLVYDRNLSVSEIQKNWEYFRTRFGL